MLESLQAVPLLRSSVTCRRLRAAGERVARRLLVACGAQPAPGVKCVVLRAQLAKPRASLAVGSYATVAVREGGALVQSTPQGAVEVLGTPEDDAVTAVGCSFAHALALTEGGSVLSWDPHAYGAGPGAEAARRPERVAALGGVRIASLSAGGGFSVAVAFSGAAYSWGNNDGGQLGRGDREDVVEPRRVASLQDRRVVAASAGGHHVLWLTHEGEVLACGYGDRGQLGRNSQEHSSVAVVVEGLAQFTVTSVSAGYEHSVAVAVPRAGGGAARRTRSATQAAVPRTFAWGLNSSGCLLYTSPSPRD